VFNKC